MKKLTTYLSLFILLLALGACGGDNATGPDPDPDPDPPPVQNDYETLDISITLPEGSDVDLAQTTVMSLSVESEVTENGQAKMAYNQSTTEMAYLFDAEDNLLMVGLVGEDRPEINIQTTTEVLFYIGFGTIFLPSEIRDKFIAEAQTMTGFDEFVGQMAQLFVNNPRMLQEGSFADQLGAKIEELHQVETIDLPTNQLQVDGADIRSGLQMKELNFEEISIVNTYRRRAHAFLYKTAFKDENGNETVEIPKISGSVEAKMDERISSTSAITSFIGSIENWAAGKGAEVAFKESKPLQLPLADNESEATYKIRVIGAAKASTSDMANMTTTELERFNRLQMETFALDFFLPIALDVLGQSESFKNLKNKESFNAGAIIDLVEEAVKALPGAYDDLVDGNYRKVLDDFLFSQNKSKFQELVNAVSVEVIKQLAPDVSSNIFVQGKELVEKSGKKLVKFLEVLDVGLKSVDYSRLLIDMASSRPLEEWTAKAKSSDVTLTPKEQVAIPFSRKELKVITKTELSDGAVFQYEWATSGKYGVLSDGIKSGTTFTSSSDKITYQGTVSSSKLGEGENIEKIYVTVSIKQGNDIKKVNSDTAYIDVQPFRYEIRPDGMTMEGGQRVELNLERVDGFNPFEDTGVYDHKVVWTTSGAYGQFAGGLKTVTTYNSDVITYEALDEEVEDATEALAARIYFKLKDDTEYQLLDEAEGTIKIDNDENTFILRERIRIETGRIDQGGQCRDGGRAKYAISVVPFKAPEPGKVERYDAKVFIKGGRDINLGSWKHGQGIPQRHFWGAHNNVAGMRPDEGYNILISFAIACPQETIDKAIANFRQIKGYGEIIVTLKDEDE